MKTRKPPMDAQNEPVAPPPVEPNLNRRRAGNVELVTETREYELITPLFGGGVNPAEADPVTIIRGPSLRGQLRFWWRATSGGEHGSIDAMKRAEDQLWGAASSGSESAPSKVHIAIDVTAHGRAFVLPPDRRGPVRISHPSRSPYAYAAFPMNDKPDATVQEGIKFGLRLAFPKGAEREVRAALWAWETFGGVGGRTRRGFGAVNLLTIEGATQTPQASAGVLQKLQSDMAPFQNGAAWPPDVPHISIGGASLRITQLESSPLDAWAYLIRKLKEFRQQRKPGTGNRPGRSNWPEPEAIRRLTRQRLTNQIVEGQRKTHAPVPPTLDEFPRAAFGLPIIFHFKDSNKTNPNLAEWDPRETSLQLAGHDRLASPLIFRPLACSDGFVGVAIILESEPPAGAEPNVLARHGVILKTKQGTPAQWNVNAQLDPVKAAMIRKQGDAPLLGSETDVLIAFLNTL